MTRLAGVVAVITGAGRGLGRSHALFLAAEGARVVVNDVDPVREAVVEEIRAAGGEAVVDDSGIGSFEAADRLIARATEAFGRVDVLVNNAGILRDRTILKMTEDEWNEVLQVHLTGSFACLQAAARVMRQRAEGGRIVNTTSSSGLLGNFGQANYGAAKAGVWALTNIAALELAKHGILVNAIAPLAATRMLDTLTGVDVAAAQTALSPDRVSPIVGYLASAAAADVTGVTFGVEGNHVFAYRMMTTHGATRLDASPWTIDAIAAAVDRIRDW